MKDTVKTIKASKLTVEQKRQFKEVLKQAAKNNFLDGDEENLFENEQCHVLLYGDKEIVAGFYTPRSTSWKGKKAWRAGVLFTSPQYRGKGIMKQALADFFYKHQPGLAWIVDNNTASIALFISLGFKKNKAREVNGEMGHWYLSEENSLIKPSNEDLPSYLKW